ncbi:hypothetical protein, partial [Halopseudomonas sabulinigri]|uniref:hypothetical protein n=1 Tax=Halopseudomonas sabulinigri TaxID=472181 RepID=UPI0033428B68
TYDGDGNPTQVLISQQTRRADGVVESMTTLNQNTYYPADLINWRVGQLDTATVTHTQGSSVVTQVSKTIYDPATGVIKQEIAEPNKPDFKTVTRYEYDTWGNVVLTGSRADFSTTPAKRVAETTVTTTYDPTLHLFPVSKSNALGHTQTSTYDLATGNKLSDTGPNGLSSYYQYDLYGRMIVSMAADGTKSVTSYLDCPAAGNCPALAKFAVKTQTLKDADGSLSSG